MEETRRRLLAIAGSSSMSMITGCNFIPEDNRQARDVEGQEVLVENDSGKTQEVTVQITDRSGSSIFSHTYTVQPGHTDQSQSVEGDLTGGNIHVSSPGYENIREPYIPQTDSRNPYSDLPPDACPAMDILVVITNDKLAITYSCP